VSSVVTGGNTDTTESEFYLDSESVDELERKIATHAQAVDFGREDTTGQVGARIIRAKCPKTRL
jgi:hypothetical protein